MVTLNQMSTMWLLMGKSAKDLVTAAYKELVAKQAETEAEEDIANQARWRRFKEACQNTKKMMNDLEIPLTDDRGILQLLAQEFPPEEFNEFSFATWVAPPGIFYKSQLSQGVCLSIVLTGNLGGWVLPTEGAEEGNSIYHYRIAATGEYIGTLQADVTELELIPQALQKICAQALLEESNAMRKQS